MASATEELSRLESELSKLQAKKEEALSSLGQALDLAAAEQCGDAEVDRLLAELAAIRGDCQRVQDGRRQIDNLHQECKDLEAELPGKQTELVSLRKKIEGSYLSIGEAAAALYTQLSPAQKADFEEYYQPLVKFTDAQQAKEEEEKKKGFFKKLVKQRNLAAEEEERVHALSEVGKRVFVAPDFLAIASRDAAFRKAVSVPEQLLIAMEPLEVEIPQLEQRLSEVRTSMKSAREQAAELGGQDRRMALWLDIGSLVFQQGLVGQFQNDKLPSMEARARDLQDRLEKLEQTRTQVQALLKLEELQKRRAAVDNERKGARHKIQRLQEKISELGQEEAQLQQSARRLVDKHGESPLRSCFASFGEGEDPLAAALRPVEAPRKPRRPDSQRVSSPSHAQQPSPAIRSPGPEVRPEPPPHASTGTPPPPLPVLPPAVPPPLPAAQPSASGRAPVAKPPSSRFPPAAAPAKAGPARPRTTTRRKADEAPLARPMAGRTATQRQPAIAGPQAEVRPAIFLDRDGTIIEDVHFLRRSEDVHFLPGVIDALLQLQARRYQLVVVSNQSGIARGYFSPQDVEGIHRFMARTLAQRGVRIAGWYFCPHHPEGVISQFKTACNCRKPAPRLLTHAASVHSIDLGQSWMIGDKWSDVQAGIAAGARGVLVRTGKGRAEEQRLKGPATFVCDNLPAAVHAILSAETVARR